MWDLAVEHQLEGWGRFTRDVRAKKEEERRENLYSDCSIMTTLLCAQPNPPAPLSHCSAKSPSALSLLRFG